MTGLESLGLFIAALLGALTAAVLGWLDSGTPFDPKKFYPSLIRGIIAATITFIATYSGFIGQVNLFIYLGAFLAGGGFDATINKLSGILQSSTQTTTPTPAPTQATNTNTAAPTLFLRIKKRLIFLQYLK